MKVCKSAAACFAFVLLALSSLSFKVAAAFTATPTSSSVLVDGVSVAFQAYKIEENNYFKLRDIAMVLRGTTKQFNVEYLSATNSIALYSNRAYTPVGGEMSEPGGDAAVGNVTPMTSKVYLDGKTIGLSAYTINWNNYFRLRDIGAAIDFGVIWDRLSNTIKIDTSICYKEEPDSAGQHIVINHSSVTLDKIPALWIEKARTDLHIAYGHTSHGSQIISGLLALTEFKGSPYIYNRDLSAGSLDLRDKPFGYESPLDLGQPDNKTWADITRTYLRNNTDINTVIWSWCGQLSSADENDVDSYLRMMQELETEFPKVKFVYMTGHLDGSGERGILAGNNNKIREFCIKNNKILYDFADIESYNPCGVYYGDKYANDACEYDSNGDQKADENWALEWQRSHEEGVDWYACPSAHSQPVNANMKAYAAWWLMARLAGWNGDTSQN